MSTSHLIRAAFYTNAIELRRHAKDVLAHPEWIAGIPTDAWEAPMPARQTLSSVLPGSQQSALAALLYRNLLAGDLSRPICLSMTVSLPTQLGGENPWVLALFNQSN